MKTQAKREKEEITLWNFCQKAASALDQKFPDWYKTINLNELDMALARCCIIGQLSRRKFEVLTVNIIQTEYPDAFGYQYLHNSFNYKIIYPKRFREQLVGVQASGGWYDLNKEVLNGYWQTLIRIRINKNKEEK